MMQKQAVEGWLSFPAHVHVESDGFVPKDGVHTMQVMERSKEASRMSPCPVCHRHAAVPGWIEWSLNTVQARLKSSQPLTGDPRYSKHLMDMIPLQVFQV